MCYGQKLGFSKNCYWEGWGRASKRGRLGGWTIMRVKELQSLAQSHEDIPSDLVLLFFPSQWIFIYINYISQLINKDSKWENKNESGKFHCLREK